jgi:hypothetical protein
LGQGRLSSRVDGTAGLPSAPEVLCAPSPLSYVATVVEAAVDEKGKFAPDSLLEGDGFELSVPGCETAIGQPSWGAETPSVGPEARRWLPIYERQLSGIGELAIVVQDRLGAILAAHQQVEHLAYEVKYLVGVDSIAELPEHAMLIALADSLVLLSRLLQGLHAELAHSREKLVDSLAGVLGCLDVSFRAPRSQEADGLAFALEQTPAAQYRAARGCQHEVERKVLDQELTLALRSSEITQAMLASDDPDCVRLVAWVRKVLQPAVERDEKKVHLSAGLIGLRALLYRASGAAQAAVERKRADRLEDELGALKGKVELFLGIAEAVRDLPAALRIAIEQLDEAIL